MIQYTSPRLNTLTCVLRFMLGRAPTHAEKVRVYVRLFWRHTRSRPAATNNILY